MISVRPGERLDLNLLGLLFSVLVFFAVLFLNISGSWMFLTLVYLILCDLHLIRGVRHNKDVELQLNAQGEWTLFRNGQILEAELKDHWKLRGFLCLWLKGDKESLSIVVSRRIIGADKFSFINIHIK